MAALLDAGASPLWLESGSCKRTRARHAALAQDAAASGLTRSNPNGREVPTPAHGRLR